MLPFSNLVFNLLIVSSQRLMIHLCRDVPDGSDHGVLCDLFALYFGTGCV